MTTQGSPIDIANSDDSYEASKRRILKKYDDIYRKRSEIHYLRHECGSHNTTRERELKDALAELERHEYELAVLQQKSYDEWVVSLNLDEVGVVPALPIYRAATQSPRRVEPKIQIIKSKSLDFDTIANRKRSASASPTLHSYSPKPEQPRLLKRSLSTTQFTPNPKEEREHKKLREQTFEIRLELAKLVSKKNIKPEEEEKIKRLRTILKAREAQLKNHHKRTSSYYTPATPETPTGYVM
ncbi:hypothetical protein AKO1_007163 [Acrasis kona]|uniref:Uncharacterized protein n=1 Tax=Acrasis kona TaxID=1008807 RepID=A0AAW2YUE4_9EUKA